MNSVSGELGVCRLINSFESGCVASYLLPFHKLLQPKHIGFRCFRRFQGWVMEMLSIELAKLNCPCLSIYQLAQTAAAEICFSAPPLLPHSLPQASPCIIRVACV